MAAPKFEVLTNSRFYLEIKLSDIPGSKDEIDGYFMECQGFQRTQEVIEIVEVTPQKWGKNEDAKFGRPVRTKIPGNSKHDNIILKRGLTISLTMWNWLKAVEQGEWAKQKRDGELIVYDQGAEEQARFRFTGAWPTKYKIAGFKAGGNEFEIEEVELAIDEFIRVK
ncbi:MULTISPECIES: phage tail protein [unclassified Anabaena]|jgi:phage tail-like protein|uniref:phage tail protein n=1 Tax=unclassified Anabaena TaxID=2619674 RepID=UPI0014456101|nr:MULTISPECIES: phage tail protein [unclassified Anabaena]MTJ10512.1 phage tail protein [Anabaena sp. UHCC 0204]MTJ56007.1 phage tail protein [Anabaena sp. UHCC 0253]